MFGFGNKQHALLGVDISSTAVKLIELSQINGTTAELYRVEAFMVEPLPPGAVVERKISDVDAVGQAIGRAVAKSGAKTRRAACAVAGSAVITKVIAMPASLSDAEMEPQIQLEADQYIPYPLEEVNIDFRLLGASPNNPDLVDVLLAASRRENVDDRVAALAIGGLSAEIVDVEAYVMESACALLLGQFDDERQDQTIAVADVGATTTTLHVLHEGKTLYTREQNFGGNQLLDEIERRYGLARAQALERLEENRLPENFATEVLGPFKEALAQQIARTLQFFYSASAYTGADQVLLAGGAARIDKIDELVEERLGFPVTVANPFGAMAIGPGVDSAALAKAAPSMMIATGLALRGFEVGGINLLPWRDAERSRRRRNFFIGTGAAVAAVLLAGVGVRAQFESMIGAQQARNQVLQQEISKLNLRIRKIEQLEQTKADLLARMHVIQQLQESRPEIVHLFDELVSSIPDGVFLTGITQQGNRVEVEGRAQSNARVSAFMRNINASAWISDAQLLVIENKDQTGTGFSHFRLSFRQHRLDPEDESGTPTAGAAQHSRQERG